jgi:flagellar protein FlaF
MSVSRYAATQEQVEDPRAAELRMLSRVTGMLLEGAKRGGRFLTEACFYNRKLWTIFQTDLVDPGNQLPDAVKANLISLAIWVQKYTGEVLDGAPVQPLIDVNRSIMEGLRPAALPPTATPARPAGGPAGAVHA